MNSTFSMLEFVMTMLVAFLALIGLVILARMLYRSK